MSLCLSIATWTTPLSLQPLGWHSITASSLDEANRSLPSIEGSGRLAGCWDEPIQCHSATGVSFRPSQCQWIRLSDKNATGTPLSQFNATVSLEGHSDPSSANRHFRGFMGPCLYSTASSKGRLIGRGRIARSRWSNRVQIHFQWSANLSCNWYFNWLPIECKLITNWYASVWQNSSKGRLIGRFPL